MIYISVVTVFGPFDIIYQILLVTNLKIDFFTIAGQIEYVSVFGLGVLEMAGFLLADTGAIGSYEVTVHVIRDRQKLGTSHINDLPAYYKMYSKGVPAKPPNRAISTS